MTRVRLAGVAVAITLGVLIAGRASALAALVQIPLHINYLELNAALRQQLYTGADGRIEVWKGEDRCQFFRAANPRFSGRVGTLQLETDGELSLGLLLGNNCTTPLSWTGIVQVEALPYVVGLALRFHIRDINLYDASHQKSLLVGRGFDLIKGRLIPRLETFSYDLTAPTRQLADLAQAAAPPDAAQRIRLALSTLRLEPDVAVDQYGVQLKLDMTVPEAAPLPSLPVIAAPLTPAELGAWRATLDSWDAFVVFAIKQIGATVADVRLRAQLFDVLLDSRERLVRALSEPQGTSGPDPVRILFLDEWSRLRAIIESAAQRGMLGNRGLEFLSFISAGDALFALDQAAPMLGMRISADDLRRLARIMAPKVTNDPLAYSFDEDSELQALFGMPQPLEMPGPLIAPDESLQEPAASPAGPSATPSLSSPAVTPPPAQSRQTAPISGLSIIWRHLWEPEAFAAERDSTQEMISIGRELRGVVVDAQNADSYSKKLNRLLELSAQREARSHWADAAQGQVYPDLVRAVAWQESCWRQFVIRHNKTWYLESKSGDVGLMQINKYVWRGLYNLPRLKWDIVYNVTSGAAILMRMLEGAVRHASGANAKPDELARSTYCAYNGGPDAYDRWRHADEPALARTIDAAFWAKFRTIAQGHSFDILSCAAQWDQAHGQ